MVLAKIIGAKFYCFISLLLLQVPILQAQNNYFTNYTTINGLPSNTIYRCIMDNKGFLWLATDAGVVRFDGRNFKTYTVKQGLPDEEALEIFIDSAQTIWANLFKQSPAFYNALTDRFESARQHKELNDISGTYLMHGNALSKEGVVYLNEKGTFIIAHHQVIHWPNIYGIRMIRLSTGFLTIGRQVAQLISNGKVIDSLIISNKNAIVETDSSNFYMTGKSKLLFYKAINAEKLLFKKNEKRFTQDITHISVLKHSLCVGLTNGEIYLLNKQSLKIIRKVPILLNLNAAFEDSSGTIWLCSYDKGLLKWSRKNIIKLLTPENFLNTNFFSVAYDKKHLRILAGNYSSEVIMSDKKSFQSVIIATDPPNTWIRKIVAAGSDLYLCTEGGTFKNFSQNLKIAGNIVRSKTAAVLNDSMVLTGNQSFLFAINNHTLKVDTLLKKIRITAIAVASGQQIYFGSTNGLHYFIRKDSSVCLGDRDEMLKNRITSLTVTPENVLLAGTASFGIMVLKNNKMITLINTDSNLASNNCKAILCTKPGEIWVGTNSGISKINYRLVKGKFSYSLHNYSVTDGLASNLVNDLAFYNDTVYAATANGICYFPSSLPAGSKNIPIYITGVKINDRDTVVQPRYMLHWSEKSVAVYYTAVDMSGKNYNYQYRINRGKWLAGNNGSVTLQLAAGDYLFEVKAVDINGNESTSTASLRFYVKAPFWQAGWFWLISTAVSFGIIFYFFHKRSVRKRKLAVEKVANQHKITELEMQAIRAQINPHFVFNCLNSIKSLNYQKRFDEADGYMDKFSFLLRATLEHSAQQLISIDTEVNYLRAYLELEQLRFGPRLTYTITIDKEVALEIQIPPMLLQPYVENAIKHGIRHLQAKQGCVDITIQKTRTHIIFSINDNGVGRERSQQINVSAINYHVSKGMQIASRREKLYDIQCEIIDKKDEAGSACGTAVVLKYPLFGVN